MLKAIVVYLSLGRWLPSTNSAERVNAQKVNIYISDRWWGIVFWQAAIVVQDEAT